MFSARSGVGVRPFVLAVLMVAASVGFTDAQTVSAPALTAAFLYNFAKFAQWPADAPAGPLRLCVLGDAAVADALVDTIGDRAIDGREVVISRMKPGGYTRGCHLLYIAADTRRAVETIEPLRNAPMLTVSDQPSFAHDGGIAEFFVEGGKMRFAINVDAAQRARVRLSSRLLTLARIVKDERDVRH